jgi:predicted transcriptional regulator
MYVTWSFFADFIFIFYAQIYRNFRDFEALCIFYLISYNAIFSKNKLGLNTMSISEITGIPRPTVIRKLQILLKKQLIKIDDKKQYYTNNEKEKINELQSHSKIEVSKLIFKILNYISII